MKQAVEITKLERLVKDLVEALEWTYDVCQWRYEPIDRLLKKAKKGAIRWVM